MANIRISQLPPAQTAITGSELVPIVQNGQTVQTTVSAITASPSLTQTFLTVTAQPTLPNSRYIGTGLGLGSSDGGSGGIYNIFLNGVSGSLENASQGIIVKNTGSTVASRTLTASGSGLSISNGNGVSGNPTFALTGLVQALATTSGTGLLQTNGTTISVATVAGTTNQISVLNGNTNPIIGLASNPVLPGAASVTVPSGGTAARAASPVNGMLRYNTDLNSLEAYANSNWGTIISGAGVSSFSAGTTGFTPNFASTGAIVLGGTLNVANGGTGATTLTGYVYGNGISAMTASTTIPTTALSGTVTNAQIANPQVTYNGVTVALGASGTITATATNPLTVSTGLQLNSGTTYDGSVARTISIDSTVATLTGTQTLTNKSISGSTNTFTNIPNSGLTNSSITINGNAVSLGGSTTVTASTTNALTIGTGLSGTSFNGSSPVTIAIANSGVTAGTYGSSSVIPVLTVNAQGQVTSISTQASNAPAYQGTWNANTNSPTLTSSVGTSGYYYVVTTAGNTTLNGVSGWNIGDWAIFSNGAWQKIPGSTTESFTNLITTNLQIGGLTGFVYANNTTGYATAATTAQLLSLLGTTPVANGGTGLTSLTAGSLVYGNGTSAYNTLAIGTNGQILTSSGTAPQWSTLSGVAVTTFSGGTTGLTPATATSGAITLGGTLVVGNGGTGVVTLTGLAYGNGTSAFTAATAAQVVSVIGTTAVTNATNATNATNLALTAGSGATNYITYASAATGNQPQYTSTGLTYNATNTALTGGINGGTF